ncbi:Putative zinc-finger [Streptomyces sp. TLI_053]|uniref:anti-sigma factor n=1 Tax=Streptomyces sp. TLI_053 TaxID=1855352 RepID=UPI00087A5830|nr:anti-sigma factor [Streptomyces sp. TLI_053]SDT83021.1 Putative zinc-finger [Streptomyces sp. TLI_053]
MTSPADDNLHLLTGAYALGAVDDADERAAFEAHLTGCAACEEETAGFGEALALLGADRSVPPPPELRARVLARLPYERQEPPAPPVPPSPRAAAPPGPARRRTPSRRWPRLALAASLTAATTLGALAVEQHDQVQRERATAEQLRVRQAAFGELLTAPDARVSTTAGPGGHGTGTVVWSAGRNQAGFLAAGLPAPAPGRVYELWLDRQGTFAPAGLLADGDGALLLTAPLDGARAVGVTEEPAGGSDRPTTQPVMALPLGRARTA